jgi:hypothetical protein
MGTARATPIFESTMRGLCIARMTGTHLRINSHRRTAPASFAARGFSQIPGEPNSLSDPERVGEVKS